MVIISSKETHCQSIMQAMNCLRNEGRLCDINLVVGVKNIPAHRCILVAGSDYFKSRFIGPFKADNLPQVNLSSITSDVSAVELMLNFLYTGEISINDENLEPVLKVSSFFMISELRDLCINFMEQTLGLNTCLKYFLLSVDHMIPGIEKRTAQSVKSRFHDYLIFQENSLDISPDQLLYLVQKCCIFEHTSNEDILVYLTDWVQFGKSKSHELLGCDILELVCSREKKILIDDDSNRKHNESFEKLKDAIISDESESVYVSKLKKVITKYFSKTLSDTKTFHLRSLSSRSPVSKLKSPIPNLEDVLITISPKKRLIEVIEKEKMHSTDFKLQEDEAVFDLCVYVPRSRTWYYMQEGLFHNVFEQICSEEVDWMYCLTLDALFCLCPFDETVNMLNLKDSSWKAISYEEIAPDSNLEVSSNDYCVCMDGQILYLLLRVKVFSDEDYVDVTQLYFKCYRLTEENAWVYVFTTSKIDTDDQFGSFAATVSSVSSEMLLMYTTTETCHLFIAEMKCDNTSGVIVHQLAEQSELAETYRSHTHILENKDSFCLMTLKFLCEDKVNISCKYKYKFRSRQLSQFEETQLDIHDSETTMQYCKSLYHEYPCGYCFTSNDRKSVWILGGNVQNGSSLREVTIDNKGRLTSHSHKPPPFSCITASVAGKVDKSWLASLQPISKYLTD